MKKQQKYTQKISLKNRQKLINSSNDSIFFNIFKYYFAFILEMSNNIKA